jgi:L-seryl-tRNA(Ser) seleniumtransferase
MAPCTIQERPLKSPHRALPSVDRLAGDPRVQALIDSYSREPVLALVRETLAESREAICEGSSAPGFDDLAAAIEQRAEALWRPWPSPLINATGVVLHTNLGRAPLSAEAMDAAQRTAAGYSDLELDLDTGRRGSRQKHVSDLLCRLTGAEAALVVNNNASAVLLGLAALATGKEVIVSRAEAVEIGGGFRIPDVLRQSGATLVEVGTTNRTYVRDFEAAITENTGAILSVHASNFRVVGFTHAPSLRELSDLGARSGIPVLHDLGSGCLLDTARFGLAHEPMPQESVEAGASLAFFSGDKLFGGPQAGIIAGKRNLVAAVSRHPLARAVRIDKVSIAALTATLLHYLRDEATAKIPIWEMIARSLDSLAERAEAWRSAIGGPTSVVPGQSTVGGGSLPGETMPTSLLSIDASTMPGGASSLAARMRRCSPPIIGRIEDERVLLDPRTTPPHFDETLVREVSQALINP